MGVLAASPVPAGLAPLQGRKCCEIGVVKSHPGRKKGRTVTGAGHGSLGEERTLPRAFVTSSGVVELIGGGRYLLARARSRSGMRILLSPVTAGTSPSSVPRRFRGFPGAVPHVRLWRFPDLQHHRLRLPRLRLVSTCPGTWRAFPALG